MSFERTIQMENHIILPVFGQFDANIKKIEKACGVSIVNRGDDVKISGEEKDVHKAWNILHSLVALVKKGEEITEQNLEYFISSAEETDLRELEKMYDDLICITVNGRPLKPKTLGQKKYVDLIKNNTIVFGIGPAGTGKTYLAMAMAITAFKNNEVNRIILTRPAIEAGEKLGFLPGDLQQKVVTQSLMAFGRGELWGQGLGNSVQKLEYLPEAHTDFIFAIIGEELGYVGVVLALLMVFFVAFRAMSIGRKALEIDHRFSGFLACSIGIWFSFQALVNVGAAAGMLPTKGLTLPLISYGGSSLLIMSTAIMMLLRIDYETRLEKAQAFVRGSR